MIEVTSEITKEEYIKAQEKGAYSLIDDYWFNSYGVYGARVCEENGKYLLKWTRGETCD